MVQRISLGGPQRSWTPAELRVIAAVDACITRWGVDKVTVDDIARESGMSRATLYRLFPGGRDVMFAAYRVLQIGNFFEQVLSSVEGATTLEDLLVRLVVAATIELRADEHLAALMASEPGTIANEFGADGFPRIVRMATAYVVPLVDPFLQRDASRPLIDLVARLVVSYFLSPSDHLDLGDERDARSLLRPLLAAFAVGTDPQTAPLPKQ